MDKILYLAIVMVLSCTGSVGAFEDDEEDFKVYDSHTFERQMIKNRARLQENSDAYKDTAIYQYCDDKEVAKQLKSGSTDICTAKVDGNTRQKKVLVAVDTDKDIVVQGDKFNIGTVDVDSKKGGATGKNIGSYVKTKDITVKGRFD